MSKLLICLITRGRAEYTKKTIDSIMKTAPAGTTLSIWHNGPIAPDMESVIKFAVPNGAVENVVSVSSPEDVGWGGGHNGNLALHNLDQFDYVLLTDNDVIYKPGWFEHLSMLLEKYPQIGVLAVWKHTSHGLLGDQFPDLVVKDQMPGCGWMFKSSRLKQLLPVPARGSYQTRGGIGEDVHFCNLARVNHNLIIAGPVDDVAEHIDGYN